MSFDNINNLISNDYESINYILRSEQRLEILNELLDGDKTSNEINEKLKVQNTNLLRTLKELEKKEFIIKKSKKYTLTSIGYLIILNVNHFLENMYSEFVFEDFWENHSLENIPYRFIRNLNIWKNASLIQSTGLVYNKPMNTLLRQSATAKRFRVVLPIFSVFHIETFIDAIYDNDGFMDLITSKLVYDAICESEVSDRFKQAVDDGYIRLWIDYSNEINLFLTATNKFYSLSLFYLDEAYDDSNLLISTDDKHFKKINNIFDCYTRNFKYIENLDEI
ncbi:helix-turn-helix transcriptional regulator [Methanosphaera cuniculi]|uniref:helix-turn-helix transcriptional regulator n=1 Tax=Methanosphaera cuniculi TaxID=1077256 RepID=UPI0026DCF360|nr:ArsR family transcriptional regulator [Methanosphaera cuniculi]